MATMSPLISITPTVLLKLGRDEEGTGVFEDMSKEGNDALMDSGLLARGYIDVHLSTGTV